MSQYSVALKKIVEELDITIVRKSSDFDTKLIVSSCVDRPALQLAGVYNYYDTDRMQVIGRVETTFLESLTEEQRRLSFDHFMRLDYPALIVCHDCEPLPECLEMAEKYDRTVLMIKDDTAAYGYSTALCAAACSPSGYGDFIIISDFNNLRNLLCVFRTNNKVGFGHTTATVGPHA